MENKEQSLSHSYKEVEQKFSQVMDIEVNNSNEYWRKMGFAAGLLWVMDNNEFQIRD